VRDLASVRRELAARQLIRDVEYDDDDEGYQDQDDPMVIRVRATRAYRDAKHGTEDFAETLRQFLAGCGKTA
jgi:hypothetical protein